MGSASLRCIVASREGRPPHWPTTVARVLLCDTRSEQPGIHPELPTGSVLSIEILYNQNVVTTTRFFALS